MTRTNDTKAPLGVLLLIVAISAVASLFLAWLVYYHQPTDRDASQWAFLAPLIAVFNGCSAVALLTGFLFILKGNVAAHRNAMCAAFVFSSAFLVAYIVHHAKQGDTMFPGQGWIRGVYFPLLVSHILLSVVALPMILATFFLSLTGRFPAHKRLARWTFPVWLYVSVTGVAVYVMLVACR